LLTQCLYLQVRGNHNGTEYSLFDAGTSPKEVGVDGDCDEEESKRPDPAANLTEDQMNGLRKELCIIHYNHDKKNKVNRQMEIAIPACKEVTRMTTMGLEKAVEVKTWRPVVTRDSMGAALTRVRYQKNQNVAPLTEKIFVMHLRESKYDPLSSCLVDFKERANCGSVKNFQLIKSFPEDPGKLKDFESYGGLGHGEPAGGPVPVLLQMGKVGKNCFNMDFQYPLSMLQAFAICLSRFDTSLSW